MDIPKISNNNNNNNIEEILDMPTFSNNGIAPQREKLSRLDRDDDQDIGFDFEESHQQVIANFQDLPVQCDLSDESSIDSFIAAHTHQQQQHGLHEQQVSKGEASTCSTLDSFSDDDDDDEDDDDEESVCYPTSSSSLSSSSYLLNASCIRNHDTKSQQQQQRQPSFSKTSSISPPSPSTTTKIRSILNPRKHDKLPKRSVSFSPCLVTEIHTMPRRTCQEWHRCYYTAHELQRMLDEKEDDDGDEWMDYQQMGQNGWGMQPGRHLVITAQEDDDILEF
eukprot:CAMPEP_0176492950 /NCGR_PEP_ID=MMETSP0200_2-20121128/9293_1 /TAXON_ID=947934 /ORGANISM="Chaetoceros sp., Strain GSL56" /LENGTH=278 /DNA_ID=CAMNT_0017890589 /DNA_START=381 /DNA_END=1217 /DNA_ORIENTATION=+